MVIKPQDRICLICGGPLKSSQPPTAKYCSHACRNEGFRRSGLAKVEQVCGVCGKHFVAYGYQVRDGMGKWCSRKCFEISHRKPPRTGVCKSCGKTFAEKSHRSSKLLFCSNKCRGKSLSKGPRDGRRRSYAGDMAAWARAVILHDKRCVRCGATDKLQAHHKKLWKQHPELRFDLANGEALCPVCHHSKHPYLRLESFLSRGGRHVEACVVCEGSYVPRKASQRTCSQKCWQRLRALKEKAKQFTGGYGDG